MKNFFVSGEEGFSTIEYLKVGLTFDNFDEWLHWPFMTKLTKLYLRLKILPVKELNAEILVTQCPNLEILALAAFHFMDDDLATILKNLSKLREFSYTPGTGSGVDFDIPVTWLDVFEKYGQKLETIKLCDVDPASWGPNRTFASKLFQKLPGLQCLNNSRGYDWPTFRKDLRNQEIP